MKALRSVPALAFPFRAQITVPGELTVACGGDLVSRDTVGKVTTWHYRSGKPVPFLNIAVAKYDVREQILASPQARPHL